MFELFGIFGEKEAQFLIVRHIRFFAVAQFFGQALRQNAQQRIREVERVHAHVQQARDGLGRRIGVQGRENKVARERGFHAHRNSFLVARLADHDDVGVGPQKGPHDEREVNAGFAVDLDLAQPFLRDFYRVFYSPDFGVRRVQVLEDGVQCGGFAGPGGATHIKQAVGLFDRPNDPLFVVGGQAQLVQRNGFPGGQDPHHHVFHTTGRRNGGDPKLDVQRSIFFELDLAVLRLAML